MIQGLESSNRFMALSADRAVGVEQVPIQNLEQMQRREQMTTQYMAANSLTKEVYGPDLLEAILMPTTKEGTNAREEQPQEEQQHDTTAAKDCEEIRKHDIQPTGSDEEVDEDIEMETPAGKPAEIVTAAADLEIEGTDAVSPQRIGKGLVSQQAQHVVDGHSPEDIANRLTRLEEQVSQGMQLLVDQEPPKRRGRPPKGMERPRVPQPLEDGIKSRLRNAEEMGYKPRDFVVDHSRSASLRVMNNIAKGRWSDEMEMDDF